MRQRQFEPYHPMFTQKYNDVRIYSRVLKEDEIQRLFKE